MRKQIPVILLTAFLLFNIDVEAQVNIRDSVIRTPLAYGTYGFHMLSGDIAKMYGPSSTVGGGLGYKMKNNIYFGLEYNYIFGGKVKNGDEILKHILTHDGQLIGQGGEYAIFQFMQRGHMIWAQLGKLIPAFGPNPNSGILIKVSAGYTQHRMDVSVQDNTAPQVKDDYKYGYDRLTRGFGLNQFIGYQFLGDTRIWNFHAGLDFSQAWTRNVREMNFDTREKDNSQHLDLYFGFKIGWIIPFYKQASSDYYYY
ncbi:MAG: hypothetical protein RQ761_08000 [Bacteroidales bacterium]|nr:hypothetical protein [Bacteroidales bacterium]